MLKPFWLRRSPISRIGPYRCKILRPERQVSLFHGENCKIDLHSTYTVKITVFLHKEIK